MDTLTSLSASAGVNCLTTSSREAYCWGRIGPSHGVTMRMVDTLGRPIRLESLHPSWLQLCGRGADDAVWCSEPIIERWIGNSSSAGNLCPVASCLRRIEDPGSLAGKPLRDVTTGAGHMCALDATGFVHCVGLNHYGQLGQGTLAPVSMSDSLVNGPSTTRLRPVRTELEFATVDATDGSTCGIGRDGALYCWGDGRAGLTGDSLVMLSRERQQCVGPVPYQLASCSTAEPRRIYPAKLRGLDPDTVRFTSISVGEVLACAISLDAIVYCWGSNEGCALGRCGFTSSPEALPIALPGRAFAVAVAGSSACALILDRRAFCWGANSYGELASLTSVNADTLGRPPSTAGLSDDDRWRFAERDVCNGGSCSPAAIEVRGLRFGAITGGWGHFCALAVDTRVYC